MKNLSPEQVAELRESLSLPADIELADYLGTGGRAHVFKAVLQGDAVIVKAYRVEAAQKYRNKYGVDIAEFEHQRNRALFALDAIRCNVARPYRVYPSSSEYTHCLVQEFIAGKTLKDLIIAHGELPADVLESGYRVIRAAEAVGIHDLDISSKNVRIVEQDDERVLKLYDFNLMPQHLHAPNPFIWLALRLGLRGKSHRDYRNLKKWKLRGENASKAILETGCTVDGGGDDLDTDEREKLL